MKVLYAVLQQPTHSQTYITTEMEFMEAQGIDVSLWVYDDITTSLAPGPKRHAIFRSQASLVDSVRKFAPDIIAVWLIHVKYMNKALNMIYDLEKCGAPVTIRVHTGFETDERTLILARNPVVKRFWLNTNHYKVLPDSLKGFKQSDLSIFEPTPVAYKSDIFVPPESPSIDRYVIRAGGAVPGKHVNEFLEIARLCPELRFKLCLASIKKDYMERIMGNLPTNVEGYQDLPRAQAAELTQRAWVCMRGHGSAAEDYALGQPLSIAEALGCGLPVVALREPMIQEYLGDAGIYFTNNEECASSLREIMAWSITERMAAQERSIARARLYRDDVVYPATLAAWREIQRLWPRD